MVDVDRATYKLVLNWVKGANNYSRGGHEIDCTSHYLLCEGVRQCACQDFPDDSGDYVFQVDPILLSQWKTKFGYTITF